MSSRSPSELLATANRLWPDDSKENVTDRIRKLESLSNDEHALYDISCIVCSSTHIYDKVDGRSILASDLSNICQFCKILHGCRSHFAPNSQYIRIHHQNKNKYQTSLTDIQLCFPEEPPRHGCRKVHVQLYSTEPHIRGNPFRITNDTCDSADSQASFALMKRWIDQCSTAHNHPPPKPDFKPTRLIRVTKNERDGARLYSPTVPVEFAALSYRWGSDSESKTLRENLVERYKDLEISTLPKTLQDAIKVTRGLGLEYIWIDRLCIAQDDAVEWTKEASVMADIYASAHIVLSATATEDCKDGFLRKRAEPYELTYTTRNGDTLKVRARQIESHKCQRGAASTAYTLFDRGWCMQERLLARRTIHFLPDEVLFECQKDRSCECGAASYESGVSGECQGFYSLTRLQAAHSMENLGFGSGWLKILWDYSKMVLSYREDSLPALSGLAACMEHLKPGKYIAGLWEHDIALQLGWRRGPTRRLANQEDVEILGPTFSWSSHAYRLESGAPNGEAICTLVSSDVTLVPPATNPYGQVEQASICLCGRIMSGVDLLSWLETPKLREEYYNRGIYLDSGFKFLSRGKIEKLRGERNWKDVLCFGLYEYGSLQWERVDALLVQPKENSRSQYVRIGIVQQVGKPWFDEHAVAGTITVV